MKRKAPKEKNKGDMLVVCVSVADKVGEPAPGFVSTCEECNTPIHIANDTMDHVTALKAIPTFACWPCAAEIAKQQGEAGTPLTFVPPSPQQMAELMRKLGLG